MTARTALYLRISVADGDLEKDYKDESNSIENQRELLLSYLNAHEELSRTVEEYVDDGYTGTNFHRPAFCRMIEDVEQGRINTILVKDLSRFGRDYIGVGDYLEQIFPLLGVRFIAVNSGYDSFRIQGWGAGADFAINNLVNALYSRDISKKVKSGLRARWAQGVSTAARPPYGYTKNPQCRGGWEIDKAAALVVKRIFFCAAEGWSTRQIADLLNREGVDPPGVYGEKHGRFAGCRLVSDEECLWDTGKVRDILGRYEYTGAFVHGGRERILLGTDMTRTVPQFRRIVLGNAHVAIVDQALFDRAQMNRSRRFRGKCNAASEYPLRGKLRCGNCRLALTRKERSCGTFYYCSHKCKAGSESHCRGWELSASVIEAEVLRQMKERLNELCRLKPWLETFRKAVLHRCSEKNHRQLREREKYKSAHLELYLAYAEGALCRETYQAKKDALSLSDVSEEEGARISEDESVAIERLLELCQKAKEVLSYNCLTKEGVDAFLEGVYVHREDYVEVRFSFDALEARVRKIQESPSVH